MHSIPEPGLLLLKHQFHSKKPYLLSFFVDSEDD